MRMGNQQSLVGRWGKEPQKTHAQSSLRLCCWYASEDVPVCKCFSCNHHVQCVTLVIGLLIPDLFLKCSSVDMIIYQSINVCIWWKMVEGNSSCPERCCFWRNGARRTEDRCDWLEGTVVACWRVHRGHGNPRKSWNLLISGLEKLVVNCMWSPGKSWNLFHHAISILSWFIIIIYLRILYIPLHGISFMLDPKGHGLLFLKVMEIMKFIEFTI